MAKTVIFTGGGSGGHVVPAQTLIKELRKRSPELRIVFIGGQLGIERDLMPPLVDDYCPISNGKLRRYFSWQNLTDLFRVFWGTVQSFFYLLKFSRGETLLFSTGGFVSVPPVIAAKVLGRKVFVHEQTTWAGLANAIAAKLAHKVLVSFEDSLNHFPQGKTQFFGYPLRDEILNPSHEKVVLEGIDLDGVEEPILLVTGGGNGSLPLNIWVETHFDELTKHFFVIHQVGAKFLSDWKGRKGDSYIPAAFLDNMIGVMRSASSVISRAGAGTVCELMALGKRSVFVPLKIAQKNEQFHNAMEAKRLLNSFVVEEDDLPTAPIMEMLLELANDKGDSHSIEENPRDKIVEEILKSF